MSNFGNFTFLELDVEAVLSLEISGKRETVADLFLVINSFYIANLWLKFSLCLLILICELGIRWSFSKYFETFCCFTKFSFHHKWNDARLLLINELPHELLNDLRPRILGNKEMLGKYLNFIGW